MRDLSYIYDYSIEHRCMVTVLALKGTLLMKFHNEAQLYKLNAQDISITDPKMMFHF